MAAHDGDTHASHKQVGSCLTTTTNRACGLSKRKRRPDGNRNGASKDDDSDMTDVTQADKFGYPNSQDFDWLNDSAVILHDQAAVAVYYSSHGELVITQRDTLGQQATIFIAPENVEHFLQGLSKRAAPQPAPKKLRVVDGGLNESGGRCCQVGTH
jgi:hypothetical protein